MATIFLDIMTQNTELLPPPYMEVSFPPVSVVELGEVAEEINDDQQRHIPGDDPPAYTVSEISGIEENVGTVGECPDYELNMDYSVTVMDIYPDIKPPSKIKKKINKFLAKKKLLKIFNSSGYRRHQDRMFIIAIWSELKKTWYDHFQDILLGQTVLLEVGHLIDDDINLIKFKAPHSCGQKKCVYCDDVTSQPYFHFTPTQQNFNGFCNIVGDFVEYIKKECRLTHCVISYEPYVGSNQISLFMEEQIGLPSYFEVNSNPNSNPIHDTSPMTIPIATARSITDPGQINPGITSTQQRSNVFVL